MQNEGEDEEGEGDDKLGDKGLVCFFTVLFH